MSIIIASSFVMFYPETESRASASNADCDLDGGEACLDTLWLLYANKESYSYNETVVVKGHVPVDKLTPDERVTIEVFTPKGIMYVKTTMEEGVADNGYYYHYFSLPAQSLNREDEPLLGEWTISTTYFSYEDHTSFFFDTKAQQGEKSDFPTLQQLQECKELGIKSGDCTEVAILQNRPRDIPLSDEEQRWIQEQQRQINNSIYLIGIGAAIAGVIAFITLRKMK